MVHVTENSGQPRVRDGEKMTRIEEKDAKATENDGAWDGGKGEIDGRYSIEMLEVGKVVLVSRWVVFPVWGWFFPRGDGDLSG